jgi:putative ABC transport system substrate-binding protein
MDRRTFIATAACSVVAISLAQAQQTPRIYRIGVLEPYPASDPISDLIRRTLAETGYAEGPGVLVEWRYANGDVSRLPTLAAELAPLKLDAVFAIGDLAIRAAGKAMPATPIVAGTDDLAGEGHVKHLARPKGNITGVSILASELNAKRLELLHAAAPAARRMVALWDQATGEFQLPALQTAAKKLGVQLNVQRVRTPADLDGALERGAAWRAEAINVLASPLLDSLRRPIIDRAARDRLPAIYQWGRSASEGGLMAYGPTHVEIVRIMCVQLDRILKGAKPSDVPAAQPTKFELVINLKTAKALGLAIPQSLLLRADEVIQ